MNRTIRNECIEDRYIDWISVEDKQPIGSPIVFMYSEDNNEYSVGHFVFSRAGIPVTHWHPLVSPKKDENN